MYRFDCKAILLDSRDRRYREFKKLHDQGLNYSAIGRCTGYSRQYVRGFLVKYKYQ